MAIIVQKFGGTSVATPEARQALLSQVKKCKDEGNDVVVVVSAMGRLGDPYATDTLINLLEQIDSNIIPRKKDLIMSCGEIISCSIISHLLESNGIPSDPLTGFQAGILTTNTFNNSEVINIDTRRIEKILNEGKVAVIAGFQGITDDGEITTLGRGGSDTAAVAVGGYLNAERVDIFTDVPGIAKTDPRIIPTVLYMTSVSYDDMFALADHGAKVIHPRAVSTALEFGVPVRVRSTFTEDLGTLIAEEVTKYDHVIVGIAIDKGPEHSNIFVLFDENSKAEIEIKLKNFLKDYDLDTTEVKWGTKEFTLIVPTDIVVEVVKSIYNYFH